MNRRHFLRGTLGASVVTLGLPLFDVFLNDNGTALAGGAPFPVRFGTWFWGCGMNPERWIPTAVGTEFDLPPELAALAGHKHHISVLSGFDALLDGLPNYPHHSGMSAIRTGIAPTADLQATGVSLDVLIAQHIAGSTPFQSLELSATGNRSHSYSYPGPDLVNPSEISPLELYERVFLGGTTPDGSPDPRLLLRKSMLSVVTDDTTRLQKSLGSHDRQRLDQYLTSVRQLEQQLDAFLAGPPDYAACVTPDAPVGEEIGTEIEQAIATHAMLADLLALALACDSTRAFNMLFSHGLSELWVTGDNTSHHQLTHDELIDDELGYQPKVTEFTLRSTEAMAAFLDRLEAIPEGDGTLLDHSIVFCHSDTSFAKTHDIAGIPIVIAGTGDGTLHTGQHIAGAGTSVTRVGLTLQQAFGMPVSQWGEGAMNTTQPIGELLA